MSHNRILRAARDDLRGRLPKAAKVEHIQVWVRALEIPEYFGEDMFAWHFGAPVADRLYALRVLRRFVAVYA